MWYLHVQVEIVPQLFSSLLGLGIQTRMTRGGCGYSLISCLFNFLIILLFLWMYGVDMIEHMLCFRNICMFIELFILDSPVDAASEGNWSLYCGTVVALWITGVWYLMMLQSVPFSLRRNK
jgi:hypothetical protein